MDTYNNTMQALKEEQAEKEEAENKAAAAKIKKV